MGRAGVQKNGLPPCSSGLGRGHVNHAQAHGAVRLHAGIVGAIHGQEMRFVANQPQEPGEGYRAAAAVAAHGAGVAVGIEVHHFEVEIGLVAQQNQAIGPNAEAAVAEVGNAGEIGFVEVAGAVVDEDEVVAGALILVELHE